MGHKPEEKDESRTRVSGVVESPSEHVAEVQRVYDRLESSATRVPVSMKTPDGEEPFTHVQQELYTLLTLYFGEGHIMIRIAACESRLLHTKVSGGVVIGEKTPDVGLFQINPMHHSFMRRHRLDPSVLEHNVAYARYLFDRRGVKDWSPSRPCWGTKDGLRFIYSRAS